MHFQSAPGMILGLTADQQLRLLIVGGVLLLALTADRLLLRRVILAGVRSLQRMPVFRELVKNDLRVTALFDRSISLIMIAVAVLVSLAIADVPMGRFTGWLLTRWFELREWLRTTGLAIALILVFGFIAWKVLHAAVQPLIRRAITRGKYGIALDEATKRSIALGQVAGNVIGVTVLIVLVLMILAELQVNIAPLLAGFGVIGVAIGFGAQNTVRDMIAGAFIVGENQYRIGDVASVGGKTGLVEGLSLRRTVLRDLDGIVHFIPNGEITVSSNYTKDFSRVNLDISVAYKEDLDRVIRVLNRVGSEVANDSYFGPLIIEAPRAIRVNSFGDSGIDIKVLGITQPARQWEVMGELRRRIRRAFNEADIEIPFPHRTIYWGVDSHPAQPPRSASQAQTVGALSEGEEASPALGADPFVAGFHEQSKMDEAFRKDLLLHRDAVLPLLQGRKFGLLIDVDGTLARINPNPSAVTITAAVRQMLDRIARKADVAVLSGRSVTDARRIIGLNALTYVGNHGVQWWNRGKETVLPEAEPYIRIAHEIASQATRRLQRVSGVVVEDKGPSLALHYRAALNQEDAIREIESFLADCREVTEMVRRDGKMVIELRPPVDADKGTALARFADERGLDSLIVLGDDFTDLDGFRTAREFGARDGNLADVVAVLTSGTPRELVEAADFTLEDTDAVEEFLTWLAGQVNS